MPDRETPPVAKVDASVVESTIEIPIFVPPKSKSMRRVKFHVKQRVAWQVNPAAPDSGESL